MFSHTSPPNPAPGPTSVRKHCFFVFVLLYSLFFLFFFGFYLFFNGSGSFLMVFVGFSIVFFGFTMVLNSFWWFLLVFHMVLLCFGWSPLVFHCFFGFRIGFERKTKGKLLENQSQPTPGPLRSFLLGLSLLCLFSFTRKGEGRIRSGEFWTYSGPLRSLFLLLSLLWGSFSGTSPQSLPVVWPALSSSGWLWPHPSSLCLLRVIRKKSDFGASFWTFSLKENQRKTKRKSSPAVSEASPELILLSSLLRTCTRQVSSESHCCVYAREK